MSLIKLSGLSDIQEAALAPEGLYYLQVLNQKPKHTDKGGDMINLMISLESTEDPGTEYATVFDTMALPGPADDKEKVEFKLLMIKRRLFWLGLADAINNEGLDPNDLIGCRTTIPCKVVQDTYEGKVNNKIQWPFLPDEE